VDTGLGALFLTAVAQAAAAPSAGQGPAMLTPPPPSAIVIPPADEECPRATGSEIVVCGRRDADARYRLPPDAGARDPDAPRNILGLRISESVSAEIEPVQYAFPNGMIARGVVARVRVAF
jgi:hypothetical protein